MDSPHDDDGCAGHNCGIVPPSLLMHIRDAAAASPKVRNAAARTLIHSNAFRAHRGHVHLGSVNPHGSGRAIVPPVIFQAIIDSPSASSSEKQLAQSNLAISSDFRSGRGDAGASSADQQPIPSRGLFRILYNANNHSRIPGREVREEGEDIIASLANDVDFQRVWDGFGQTYNFYKSVFNRNSIDDQGMDIVASVHFDDDDRPPGYDNAMWTSDLKQMIFGDGDGEVFTSFTSAIDVIAHELTHGVTDLTANLPYHRQSGALNESLSDAFGSMVKQWAAGETVDEADWLIGEGLFVDAVNNPALRSMANPGKAFKDVFGRGDDQPSHMNQYEDDPDTERGDHGGVHFNSGIPNHAFYLAAKEMGGETKSWETVGPAWYNSLLDPKLATFAADETNWMKVFKFFANLTVEHAGSKNVAAAVTRAWKEVGVL